MINRNTNKFVIFAALTAAVMITAVIFTGQLSAEDQDPFGQISPEKPSEMNSKAKDVLKIGTYNPQAVFDQHPLKDKLMKQYGTIQKATQKAQKEGDQQKVMKLQQQFEQQRNQIIEKFHSDVDKAIPAIAKKNGIKVIALEISYTADDIATKNVTKQLMNAFTEKDKKEERKMPKFQFQNKQQ